MVPEIWILRHGEAEPAGPRGDGSRRLTAEGEERAAALGRDLAARGLRAARVLSSPLARARRTAELAAPAGVEVEIDPRLSPGGDAAGATVEGPFPLLLVGHNPDLEELILRMTGAAVPLGKGTFVRVAGGRVLERRGAEGGT